jgi:hypothetical protein
VVALQLVNEQIEMFRDNQPRLRSEAKFPEDPQKVYDAFKLVNKGANIPEGIELVMMRGGLTLSKRRKISSGRMPLVEDLGEMGGMAGVDGS